MKSIIKVFQVAFVFIGTIVGAGLASGKEITNFFTVYGYKSFYYYNDWLILYFSLQHNFKNKY